MENLKVEYRPELKDVIGYKDMGMQLSPWAKKIALSTSHSGDKGFEVLSRPSYSRWIKKTIVVRLKNARDKIFWLDKDGKVISYCDCTLPMMVNQYIRDYLIPKETNPDKLQELYDSLISADYPMLGEVTLIRTYPLTIKESREKIGMSRAELSRQLEIPIRTLENWESGKNQPPAWAEKLIMEKLDTLKNVAINADKGGN